MFDLETPVSSAFAPPFLGICVGAPEALAGTGLVRFRAVQSNDLDDFQEADCLDHVHPRVGDRLLLVYCDSNQRPVVVGVIGSNTPRALHLSTGHQVQVNRATITLLDPKGCPVLEIDTSNQVPKIQPAQPDLEIEVAGQLKISARSIDLQSKLGDINIKANDDVVVVGERIRLN